jgi:GTPase Era involved in 16S rRNA processing
LGNEIFTEENSPNSVTTKCSIGSRLFDEKQIFVVDTPGFLDTTVTESKMREEVATSYQMTATPGPHAFLLVIEPTRFTVQESEALTYLDKIFGSQSVHHTIIVFTKSDSFRKSSIEQYLDKLEENAPLRHLIKQCQNRYISVNNWGTQSEKDLTVKKLIDMISDLIKINNGEVYRSDDFDAIAKGIDEAKSKGIYQAFKPDGTFNLLPQTKKIIIDGRLRRTLEKKSIQS